ncbi:SixA phosphatase family protein [Mycobacterium botniense]|uniref:Phosphohistidine phosphatase n=1 Tax=Mycobacterium botniense TaxID=84962 RepID=A0A7I9XZ65_9MYCO|nr:histidine phosphatase family protein [Mycobacterium botniense]GFG75098.1 hypothetical protein MBOT_24630 [Mycobacterium botniense]
MDDQRRTLALLRHAKSAYPEGIVDHERPLAPRGVRQARLAGDWLRANLPVIDHVLCSTATRARQTLEYTGVDSPVHYSERLYGTTAATVIEEIHTVDDGVMTLLVVGHEPVISEVAVRLAGAGGTDTAAVERISAKFPTSAIAVLRIGCSWERLEPGGATLINFHVPR